MSRGVALREGSTAVADVGQARCAAVTLAYSHRGAGAHQGRRRDNLDVMQSQTPALFPELTDEPAPLSGTGVLPDRAIRKLIDANHLQAAEPFEERQVQPASLDLRLGPVAYQVRASFLPSKRSTVQQEVEHLRVRTLDLSVPSVLERGNVYIIPLMESVNLPLDLSAKANAKSTTGRLDVLVRTLCDYTDEFERVPAGYRGALYVEVAPKTFGIYVHQGTTLNQVRFVRGSPPYFDSRLMALHQDRTIAYDEDDTPLAAVISNGLWVSIDLQGGSTSDVIGYHAKNFAPPVDLDRINHYDLDEFWVPIVGSAKRRLILEPDKFYILASKERIRIPNEYAAEMVSYDPSVGEFRIHYAGFFDPGFGYAGPGLRGTQAVLEVRSHEVPFSMRDGQRVGRLIYERLLGVPARPYGPAIGSSYQGQGVALSKQFKRPVAD